MPFVNKENGQGSILTLNGAQIQNCCNNYISGHCFFHLQHFSTVVVFFFIIIKPNNKFPEVQTYPVWLSTWDCLSFILSLSIASSNE